MLRGINSVPTNGALSSYRNYVLQAAREATLLRPGDNVRMKGASSYLLANLRSRMVTLDSYHVDWLA